MENSNKNTELFKAGSLVKNIIKEIKHVWGTMGCWMSYLWWGGDPDALSPLSGLSKREIYYVQQSWSIVYSNYVDNGSELLRRFFAAHPHTQDYFKMIKGQTYETYAQNPQFKAHVINLMGALNQAVVSLNQPEVVVAMMNKLGESHGRRKITRTNFEELQGVIVDMFTEVLKLDDATLKAWSKTLQFWYTNIFSTLEAKPQTS